MQINEIANQPCDISDILPRARMNGDTRERTAGFTVGFNYSANILGMLSFNNDEWALPGLWDDEGRPHPGVSLNVKREFPHYRLVMKRNNKSVLTFTAEKLHNWTVEPQANEMFGVTVKAFGVCSEGDTERLHKLIKDPGITVSIEAAADGQEST